MDLKGKLRQGMRIFDSDDREVGTVERVEGDYAYVGGRRIPVSAFDRMDNDRLYYGESGRQYFTQDASRSASRAQTAEGEIRVPVAEERLDVDKRQAELGAVEVRKTVETENVSVPVELQREEVHVDKVDVADRPLAGADAGQAFQETTIRVPVRGEEAVVRKEAVVTGEVVVDKERTTERQEIRETLRKERVEIDEDYKRDRSAFQQSFEQRKGTRQPPASSFEEVEPNYRMGYEAGYDTRHAGKRFEDVEPDLRRDYETRSGGGAGDSWQHLREEIREGYERSRNR
jgi:uncharacterized protein (TIGR02271 family)